jgi:hypothetical protein
VVESGSSIAWGRDAAEQIRVSFVSANWFDEAGYEPEHGDPIAFAAALTLFVMAGAIAALIPAMAVLRGNPVEALRHQ